MDTAEIRQTFLDFFAARDHLVVPSSSLIPIDPTLLLTTAGMVQFKPYMMGEEKPPYPRAVSVQKCARTTDIEIVGLTKRHLTFFEMLGNFSLGDYFKEKAIPWAWDLVTEGFGFDPERLWVTVYVDDDEAASIWLDTVGLPPERLQRAVEDNFWTMGVAGPCGPSSEIFFDKGPGFGQEGGPLVDDERHVEIWNLVFMQYLQDDAGKLLGELPQKNIDTGAGLERIATARNELDSVFDVDSIRRVLEVGESMSGRTYGDDERSDVSLRILAEHGRSSTFLVTDGVFPSNETRGYVLRRVIRRAVRHAWLLGIERHVMVPFAERTIELLGEPYPELVRGAGTTLEILDNEEGRFRQTLKRGLAHLDEEMKDLEAGAKLPGSTAFLLHDTFGFPIELTREIGDERGREVDMEGFEAEMARQQRMAHDAAKKPMGDDGQVVHKDLVAGLPPTRFLGYDTTDASGEVLGLVSGGSVVPSVSAADGPVDVVVLVDRSPFYAESGGQVGDTGAMTGTGTVVRVVDTQVLLPGYIGHLGTLETGTVAVGDRLELQVDAARRAGIRRHHTATHLLHWALRDVLGEHVKQQGSLVEDDRLRFDFSHFQPVAEDEMARVEALANGEVLTNGAVRAYETSKSEADARGVIAFFGDKYGDTVRVLEAGRHSLELCGGTHVSTLGEIGPIVVVSESSIGSNIRRIEALAGAAAVDWLQRRRSLLREAGDLLRASDDEVPSAISRRLDELASSRKEIDALKSRLAAGKVDGLLGGAFALPVDGAQAIVVRGDETGTPKEMQRLAHELRQRLGSGAVVLGADFSGKASLVAAVTKDLQEHGLSAADAVRDAAGVVGGGTGRNTDTAMAGGREGGRVDEALEAAETWLRSWSPD